jgi:hypothetical protein
MLSDADADTVGPEAPAWEAAVVDEASHMQG